MYNDSHHQIFNTPLWGWKLGDEKHHVSDYIDYIHELSTSEYSQQKSNFGGWQSRDNLNEDGIFREFTKTLTKLANGCVSKATVSEMWANINNYKDYNGQHRHDGVLAGVFYCSVPKNSGRLILVDPRNLGVRDRHRNNYPINPEPLTLIIFPSWLDHFVEPNMSNEPRISLSFNIDQEH